MDQEKGNGLISVVIGRELIDVVVSLASRQPSGLVVEGIEVERVKGHVKGTAGGGKELRSKSPPPCRYIY